MTNDSDPSCKKSCRHSSDKYLKELDDRLKVEAERIKKFRKRGKTEQPKSLWQRFKGWLNNGK